jgi:predicted TPR repeat methyltransferase
MNEEYTSATYGDRIAAIYDERYLESFREDTAEAVTFLGSLADDGPVLELGIGTGRVALPLAASGLDVHGIDASEAMAAKLREKPGGEAIAVTIGDFARFTLDERFSLIYVVFNTFFGLLTQEEQVSCFATVAGHLRDGGVFAMQAFVPDPTRFDAQHQRTAATSVGVDHVALETSMHDPVAQRTDSQHVVIRNGRIDLYPVKIRYAFVSELDLMARLGGLRVRERWADWDRTPFPGPGTGHISVWELAKD